MSGKTPNIEITQEMIDLYDDYTHLSLDRRKFMDALTKLAGSSALAVTAATMMGASAQAASIVAADDARITGEDVTYADGTMSGYLVRPAESAAPLGAVIVVHENRGLNEHTRDVARRIALEGFVALAPDYLSPLGGTPSDEDAARGMFRDLDRDTVLSSSLATIAFLAGHEATNGKVGAMGFCWGGGTVNQMAVHSSDLLAAVPYYGSQPDPADVPSISARVLAHYGALDDRINAGIGDFRAALEAAGTNYEIHVYEGANHAFNNDTSEARYDPEAAALAWERTVALFRDVLS